MTAAAPDCRDCPLLPRVIEVVAANAEGNADVAGALRNFVSNERSREAEWRARLERAAYEAAEKARAEVLEREQQRAERDAEERKERHSYLLSLISTLRPVAIALCKYVLPPVLAGVIGYQAATGGIPPIEYDSQEEQSDVQP